VLFNSYVYLLLFLPISVFGFYFLGKHTKKSVSYFWLVGCSLFFYGFWNPIYLILFLFSLVFNFSVGKAISEKKESTKSIMIFGVVINLALLAYFKYFNFFIDNVNALFETSIHFEKIVLPLAISFFTFQQIAYLVDAYEGKAKDYSPSHYFLFITFFPQLIAGPIVHHKQLMPQFEKDDLHLVNQSNITLGLIVFALGLAKKVILADTFAIWANEGFKNVENLTLLSAWFTSLSYTFQLYFDFSGYSEMALGSALLFNIRLPLNFTSPYRALSIQEFWREWHMTLSTFLRDYLYIPLGGNRKGKIRTYVNLMATMVLGGMWHGAGWQFIIWGFLHGLGLTINRAWTKLGIKMPKLIAWLITFNFVNICWVFFRSKSLGESFLFLSKMYDVSNLGRINPLWGIAVIVGLMISVTPWSVARLYLKEKKWELSYPYVVGLALLLFACFLVLEIGRSNEFLYFQF